MAYGARRLGAIFSMGLEEAEPSGVVFDDLCLFPVVGVPGSDHKVAMACALVVASLPWEWEVCTQGLMACRQVACTLAENFRFWEVEYLVACVRGLAALL
jgi:hypothetical protein